MEDSVSSNPNAAKGLSTPPIKLKCSGDAKLSEPPVMGRRKTDAFTVYLKREMSKDTRQTWSLGQIQLPAVISTK